MIYTGITIMNYELHDNPYLSVNRVGGNFDN